MKKTSDNFRYLINQLITVDEFIENIQIKNKYYNQTDILKIALNAVRMNHIDSLDKEVGIYDLFVQLMIAMDSHMQGILRIVDIGHPGDQIDYVLNFLKKQAEEAMQEGKKHGKKRA